MKVTNQFRPVVDFMHTAELLTLHCICLEFDADIFDCYPIASPPTGPHQPHSSCALQTASLGFVVSGFIALQLVVETSGLRCAISGQATNHPPEGQRQGRGAPGGNEIFRCRAHTSPSDATFLSLPFPTWGK